MSRVDMVQFHFSPQGGAANFQQAGHLLNPPTGHPCRVNNGVFLNITESDAGRETIGRGF